MRNMRYSNVPVKEQLYIERSKVSEKKEMATVCLQSKILDPNVLKCVTYKWHIYRPKI